MHLCVTPYINTIFAYTNADMSGPPKLSLYAHLLGENKQEGATISAAPVKYDAKAEEEKKKDGTVSALAHSLQGH